MADIDVTLSSNIGQIKKEAAEAILRGLEACGLKAEGYAKKLCPVDTGNLRNSITHDTAEESGDLVEYIGTNVEYAPYVELGTLRTKAQPFIKPAVEDHADQYKRIFEHYLKGGDF